MFLIKKKEPPKTELSYDEKNTKKLERDYSESYEEDDVLDSIFSYILNNKEITKENVFYSGNENYHIIIRFNKRIYAIWNSNKYFGWLSSGAVYNDTFGDDFNYYLLRKDDAIYYWDHKHPNIKLAKEFYFFTRKFLPTDEEIKKEYNKKLLERIGILDGETSDRS